MALAAAFLAFAVTMLVAWLGSRVAALALFGLSLILSVALYFHHATDQLPLSF